ncbi:hypothetical protein N0V82_002887 [Gnomoniopsis sp. IMI 355080]|nr:hypothetical protein N0V82_002887 [Gnomoniopsis sp. IMI 355080]
MHDRWLKILAVNSSHGLSWGVSLRESYSRWIDTMWEQMGPKRASSHCAKASSSVMRNAVKQERRKALFEAKERRFPGNVGRLTEILQLSHEIAQCLGFEHHAAFKMEDEMHEDVLKVQDVLLSTLHMLQTVAKREVDTMLLLKHETDPESTTLYSWDWSFYTQELKKQTYRIASKKIQRVF